MFCLHICMCILCALDAHGSQKTASGSLEFYMVINHHRSAWNWASAGASSAYPLIHLFKPGAIYKVSQFLVIFSLKSLALWERRGKKSHSQGNTRYCSSSQPSLSPQALQLEPESFSLSKWQGTRESRELASRMEIAEGALSPGEAKLLLVTSY